MKCLEIGKILRYGLDSLIQLEPNYSSTTPLAQYQSKRETKIHTHTKIHKFPSPNFSLYYYYPAKQINGLRHYLLYAIYSNSLIQYRSGDHSFVKRENVLCIILCIVIALYYIVYWKQNHFYPNLVINYYSDVRTHLWSRLPQQANERRQLLDMVKCR